MEALSFDQVLAVKGEAALSGLLRRMSGDRLLGTRGGGKDEDFSVSEDAVHVEQDQPDFFGTEFGGAGVGHRQDFSIQ